MTDRPALATMVIQANPVPDPAATAEHLDAYQSLLALIDERSGAMDHHTQHADTPTNTPPPPRRSRPAAWAFAAAFILILIVVGGAALLLRSNDTPVTDEPAPETTVAVTRTETGLVESLVWSRVPYDEAVFGQEAAGLSGGSADREMASVTTGGPGIVAVGTMDGAAAVWTSVDGLAWARVPHNAVFGSTFVPLDGMPGTHILDVTAGGPGLVAVGGKADPDPLLPPGPEAWVSSDGITWSRIPALSVEGGGPNCCVAAGDPGLVVIGDERAWTSVDGVTWPPNRRNNLEDMPVIDGYVTEVIAGGPGFMAVGSYDWVAAVWTSSDGITWSRVPDDEAVFGRPAHGDHQHPEFTSIGGVTIGGPGLVAVGTWANLEVEDEEAIRGMAAVWTSSDGITWSRVPHDEAVFGDSEMRSVAAVGDGLVAVGSTLVDFENCEYECGAAAVWTSSDGITWSRVPHDEAVFAGYQITSVTAGGPGVVAVGAGDGNPAVWIAVPPE